VPAEPRGDAGRVRADGWGGLVYAVGRLTPQFSSLGVEKEFAQLVAGEYQGGPVGTGLLRNVLAKPDNRYLSRHLCWVFTTGQVEAFAVLPRDDAEAQRLIEVLPEEGSVDVVHVVAGRAAPDRPESPCAASGLPLVAAEQLWAFTLDEFAAALPGDDSMADSSDAEAEQGRRQFEAIARDLFTRFTRSADNRGFAEEHRARNYCALRYPKLYQAVARGHREGKVLIGIEARHSHSGARRVVSVRLTFRHRHTDITERYHCLVDVTEVFPFLTAGLEPTYD
jgi:hypothetical protein